MKITSDIDTPGYATWLRVGSTEIRVGQFRYFGSNIRFILSIFRASEGHYEIDTYSFTYGGPVRLYTDSNADLIKISESRPYHDCDGYWEIYKLKKATKGSEPPDAAPQEEYDDVEVPF